MNDSAGTQLSERPPTAHQVSEYPGSVRAWWAVGVFCFAALVSYTDRLILNALVDPIKHALGVGDSAVSLLQGAAFALVYVFSGLLLGRLADRKRRLTILVIGSTFWCAGTVACGLAPSFWLLFLARVVVGIGEAALAPAAVSIIADSFLPTRRGAALGIFMLGFSVGGPASVAIGSVMLSWATAGAFSQVAGIGALEPWRAVLVLVGLGGLVVPALFLTLREPARREAAPVLPLRAMVKRLAADRQALAPVYLAMGLLSIGDYGTLAWMPSVLSRRFAMPSAELGEMFGAITAVAGILGSVLGGVGSDSAARRYGTQGRLLFALGATVFASLGAVLISSSHLSVALIGLGVWTLCTMISHISGIAAVQSLVPNEYRGVGIALVAFCNTLLGLGFGPTFVALVTERLYGDPASVGFAITTTALPAGASAAVLFFLSSRASCVRHRSA